VVPIQPRALHGRALDPSHHLLYHLRCPGPLIHVIFTQLAAFVKIARVVGVVDQAGRKEFAEILEGW